MTVTTIAIDATGGDFGPPVTVPASIKILNQHKDLQLILVGDADSLKDALRSYQYDTARLDVQHASQRVEMDESPAVALRTKKDSSMRVAINLVKEGRAQACVSAGNTGALMATARFVLKTIPGVDRPAIISTFPTLPGLKNVRILDLGANVDSTADNLFQFGVMGSVLATAVDNISSPKVYLLNIGTEEIKGTEAIKQAAQSLSNIDINYCGFIEGDALYKGDADVVVCDGFVGNVALKTTEGVAMFITKALKESFMRNIFTKLGGMMVKPILRPLIKRLNPDNYNGATLIGLQGIVIKSHGGANVNSFARSIAEAIVEVEKNIPERIKYEVTRLLTQHNQT